MLGLPLPLATIGPGPTKMRHTPAGEGCTVTDSMDVTPALTPQLSATLAAGIHCVSVTEIGQVPGTVIASVRFNHL